METSLIEISCEDNKTSIKSNLESYGEYIDSYYEDHILESKHYRLLFDNKDVGYCSVFENEMITQFSIRKSYSNKANMLFEKLISEIKPKSIYVATCDIAFMNLALEYQKKIELQDWIFHTEKELKINSNLPFRQAEEKDIGSIREIDEGFFQNLEKNVASGEIFIEEKGGIIKALGIIEKSKLWTNVVSLGMFVPVKERGKGFGARTISSLIQICQDMELIPIAGCFSKNKYSINALKKAGMISTNRLIKMEIK